MKILLLNLLTSMTCKWYKLSYYYYFERLIMLLSCLLWRALIRNWEKLMLICSYLLNKPRFEYVKYLCIYIISANNNNILLTFPEFRSKNEFNVRGRQSTLWMYNFRNKCNYKYSILILLYIYSNWFIRFYIKVLNKKYVFNYIWCYK